ncbi:MAG: DUF3467 domain-containing protein [Methanosarcinales archaeon]|nr:DUF3467 domain-containing protein [Methanosarcinales archaeon]
MNHNIKMEISRSEDFKQVYAIGAMGGHSPYDFRIALYNDTPRSFGNVVEGTQIIDRKIETEVILSPSAAKELSNWLNQHLIEYEKMFGTIATTDSAIKATQKEQPDSTQIQGYM